MTSFSIDAQFARFGSTRYATDKITSFTVTTASEKVQGDNNRALVAVVGGILAFIALLMLSLAVGQLEVELGLYGLLLLAPAICVLAKAYRMPSDGSGHRMVYRLILVTNAGETAAFETGSASEMNDVESALEQAMLESRR